MSKPANKKFAVQKERYHEKTLKKIAAAILTVVMAISGSTTIFAESSNQMQKYARYTFTAVNQVGLEKFANVYIDMNVAGESSHN